MNSKPSSGHFHAVGFYRDPSSLSRIVADFLIEGFEDGAPAVIIATPSCCDGVATELARSGLDVDQLKRNGDLLVLDSSWTLDLFMRDGAPDPKLFRATMVPVMQQLSRGRNRAPIRAFGEMVNVLWQEGLHTAAIRLEMLWNELANSQDFSLLCGYSMGNFYKDAADAGRQEICAQHTHIVPLEGEASRIH